QGVVVTQPVALNAGVAYELSFDWYSRSFIGSAVSAGVFEIVVNGQALAQDSAPQAIPNLQVYGHLTGTFVPVITGEHTVGFRVLRAAGAGEEIINYVDNFLLRPRCRADFNASGAVSVQDVFDFLAAYFANDPLADFNNSGGISVQDIFDFLA